MECEKKFFDPFHSSFIIANRKATAQRSHIIDHGIEVTKRERVVRVTKRVYELLKRSVRLLKRRVQV